MWGETEERRPQVGTKERTSRVVVEGVIKSEKDSEVENISDFSLSRVSGVEER